ncbi:MAG TPA: serine/threonine protein phosphatase [Clostridiales bacterium]|nr:MAG: serine/threonine protein phosphatase [Clostridiales bacterium GWD2_32_59]HAN09908.1 serine/threonine protein phosphatase [Clostridiales bacterium]
MNIYAISDLHFGEAAGKDMDLFGEKWLNHKEKIINNWKTIVTDNDIVLMSGDTSWATSLEDAKADLDEISNLPGRKVISRGNHDYWWKSLYKLNNLYENIFFIQNETIFEIDNITICATKGYLCPNDYKFNKADEKIYKREVARLKLALSSASKKNTEYIILLLHYPPTNDKLETSGFIELINKYNVKKVIYGHLHGKRYYKDGLQGVYNRVDYILASSDYLDFKPRLVNL